VNARDIAEDFRAEALRLRQRADQYEHVAAQLDPPVVVKTSIAKRKPRRRRMLAKSARSAVMGDGSPGSPRQPPKAKAEVRLRVVTGEGPTRKEMRDRELVHTTSEGKGGG